MMRSDMPKYQKERVGVGKTFVVACAWLDFIGDVTWTHQRFFAYYNRGEETGFIFGMVSLIILIISTLAMTYKISTTILLKHRGELIPEKLTSNMFITMVFISWTDPESIVFFPWQEKAYTGVLQSALPNEDCVRVTLYKLVEDVPEFILQVAYFASGEWDTFTAANLGFTLIMLFYLVLGKLFRIFLVDGQVDDSVKSSGDVEMSKADKSSDVPTEKPRVYGEIVDDVKKVLEKSYGIQLESRKLHDIVEEAQEDICIENWDALTNVKAKVLALAQELGIKTTMTVESMKSTKKDDQVSFAEL